MSADHRKPSALPARFVDFYRSLIGPDSERQIQALLAGPSVKVVRAIPSRYDVADLQRLVNEFHLALSGTETPKNKPQPFFDDAFLISTELASRLSQSTVFDEGKFYLQSIPSYLVIKHLPLEEADYVLDVCASPGGKALHCYDRMNRLRPVIANEPAGARRLKLSSVLKLYGAEELPILGIDGGLICQFVINEIPLVVLDAPCSGEAHLLSQPQRRKEWTPRQTRMLAQRQLSLAVSALHALKPGGLLLYATCALSPFENELLIQELLHRFGEAVEPHPWPVQKPRLLPTAEDAPISPLCQVRDRQIDPRIVQTGWRFRPADFGEPFFGILLKKLHPTAPKKTVEPYPIHYERKQPKKNYRLVKVGPGRREFLIPADWPTLPPLPYLRLGR